MKFRTFILSVLISFASKAEVVEVTSMALVEKLITSQTLVVFDIDNTLLAPVQTLGSDQWFGYLVEQFQKCGASESQAIDLAITRWSLVQKATKVRATEKGTPDIVQKLVQHRVAALGLTARPLDLARATSLQLQSARYPRLAIPELTRKPQLPKDTIFHDGVIFVGPNLNKGTVLKSFLQNNNLQYDRIVFVDDKAKHVKNVDEALKETNSDYIGLRYGAEDKIVAAFNSEIANKQWGEFTKSRKLISDAEAAILPIKNFECHQ